MNLIRRPRGYTDLLVLDKYDIRGELIERFFSKCCDNNEGKIERTIAMFSEELFEPEMIMNNITSSRPLSFINEKVNPKCTPPYPERMNFNSKLWLDYCMAQRNNFIMRYEKKFNLQSAEENI